MNTIELQKTLFARYDETDSGALGKVNECAVRSYIMGRRVSAVKQQGKTDIRFTWQGRRYYCEIKTACGELDGCDRADYVIYCPNVDLDTPAEWQNYVFSHDEWLDFINGYTGRGAFIRHDSKRGHDHIQSFYVSETCRPKASKPIANYIAEVMFNAMNLEDFFAER